MRATPVKALDHEGQGGQCDNVSRCLVNAPTSIIHRMSLSLQDQVGQLLSVIEQQLAHNIR